MEQLTTGTTETQQRVLDFTTEFGRLRDGKGIFAGLILEDVNKRVESAQEVPQIEENFPIIQEMKILLTKSSIGLPTYEIAQAQKVAGFKTTTQK